MKNTYQATLFAPDGEFVTDFKNRGTVQNVWNVIADMGSRWIFYPLPFVTTSKTVIDTPNGLEYLKGKRIKTVAKILKSCNQEILCEHLNNGWPLDTAIETN